VIDGSNIRQAFEEMERKAADQAAAALAAISLPAPASGDAPMVPDVAIERPHKPPHIHPVGPERPIEPAKPHIRPIGPERSDPDEPVAPPHIRPVGPERVDPERPHIRPVGPEQKPDVLPPHIHPVGPERIEPDGPHIRPVGPEQPVQPPHIRPVGPERIEPEQPHIRPIGPEVPSEEEPPQIHPIGPEVPTDPEEPQIHPVGPEVVPRPHGGPMLGEGGEKLPFDLPMPEPMPMPMPLDEEEEGPFGGLIARLIGRLKLDFGGELNAPPSFHHMDQEEGEAGRVETSTTKLPGGGFMIVRRFHSGQSGDNEDAPQPLMTPPSPLFGSFLPAWLRRPMPMPMPAPVPLFEPEPEVALRQQEHIKLHFGGDEDRSDAVEKAETTEESSDAAEPEHEPRRHRHGSRGGCKKHRKHRARGGLLNRLRNMFHSTHGHSDSHHERHHKHKKHHKRNHKRHHREEEEEEQANVDVEEQEVQSPPEDAGEGFVHPEWAGTIDLDPEQEQQLVEAEVVGEAVDAVSPRFHRGHGADDRGEVDDSVMIATMAEPTITDEFMAPPAAGRHHRRGSFARFIRRHRVALAVSVSLAALLLVLLVVALVRRRAAQKAAAAYAQVAMMPPPATMAAYVPLADAPVPLVVQ
jgi:hypothetical protein